MAKTETGRPAARSLEQEVWVTDTKAGGGCNEVSLGGDNGGKTGRSCWLPDSWMRHEKRMISRLWSGPLEMMASFMEMRTLEPEEVKGRGDLFFPAL